MYLKEKLIRFLKIKNIILLVVGIFLLFTSVWIMLSLMSTYWGDWETVVNAKATPECILYSIIGIIFIADSVISRILTGKASFYSSYFEGDLDGVISYEELSEVMLKSKSRIKFELKLFRILYMKKFDFSKEQGNETIMLFSKKVLCECKNCGAPIEKRIYFTGICPYCKGSDLFARVLTDNKFYSISNDISCEKNNPSYYTPKFFNAKKSLCIINICIISVLLFIFLAFGLDSVANYFDEEYLTDTLLSGESYSSFELIRGELMDNILLSAVFAPVLIIVLFFLIKRFLAIRTADKCSYQFSQCTVPFLNIGKLSISIGSHNSKHSLKSILKAINYRYLKNCSIEKHGGIFKIALAKKIVKDICPYCGGAIVGAVDEHYKCNFCHRIIMGVISQK